MMPYNFIYERISQVKNSDMNSVLKRLHEGLEFRGIAKRGRIAEVVKTTGYSEGLV